MKKLIEKLPIDAIKKRLMTKEGILIAASLVVAIMIAANHTAVQSEPTFPNIPDTTAPSLSQNTQGTAPVTTVPPPTTLPATESGQLTTEPEGTLPQEPENPLPQEPDGTSPQEPEGNLPSTLPPPTNANNATTPPVQTEPVLPAEDVPPELPAETTAPTEPVTPPDVSPDANADSEPQLPEISLKYVWVSTQFRPCADIYWPDENASYIEWVLCDADGQRVTSGQIGIKGAAARRIDDWIFYVSSPLENDIYPKGYVMKFIPHIGQGLPDDEPLEVVVLELPYFEVSTRRVDGELSPVISTNIGMYFVHSVENIEYTELNGKLRVLAELMPREGEPVPLIIDIVI